MEISDHINGKAGNTIIEVNTSHKKNISTSLYALAWQRFIKNKPAVISLVVITIFILIAILGPLIRPDQTPYANNQILELSLKKPGTTVQLLKTEKRRIEKNPNYFEKMLFGEEEHFTYFPVKDDSNVNSIIKKTFWLGTDRFGRDMLSRLMAGTRISIAVGFISVLISLFIGISLGAIAGYFRGKIDDAIVWLINVIWSIPTILLVIAITMALGKGFWQVFVAVGLTMWVEVARMVRGQVISLRENEYVEACKALGYSNFRIILKHILPNIMGPVIVISAANFASSILVEAGLSFLGIGTQPPMTSWGSMIKDHYGYIIVDAAYLAILPGIAIMLLVLAFILVGNGLRDAFDVKGSIRD